MSFDVTYNYNTLDLTSTKNLAYRNFTELIKTLITLSVSAERQKEIIGQGEVCDEMAIDFENHFTNVWQTYPDHDLLTKINLEKLKDLDTFLEERSGNEHPDFWNDALLGVNAEWEIVREKAKNILTLLGAQHLTLEIIRTDKHHPLDNGKQLQTQITETRIVETGN